MAYYTDINRYFREMERHSHLTPILFEGDSWFSIPDIANIPIQLDSREALSILCLADPGDTLEALTEGFQYRLLSSLLHDNRLGQKWAAIILSVAGNDVIGPDIAPMLKAAATPGSKEPNDYLDQGRLDTTLALVRERIDRIRLLRDNSEVNRDTPIFVHTYNYLTPRNVGHTILAWKVRGPWLYPFMMARGIADCGTQRAIVMELLDRFYHLLKGIEAEPNSNFYTIDSREALPPAPCEGNAEKSVYWNDEIHPTSKGFAIITERCFIPRLRQARVI